MAQLPFRVGIIGLQPGRSWGAVAHLPALAALSDDYTVVGVANTTLASSQAAAAECGIPHAFGSVVDLVASPEIDVVLVTVKVPYHRNVVAAALNAGKHVYCEWPLGNGLTEARELAALARERDLLGVIGLQALASPQIRHARNLIAEGFVGEVLSTTLVGSGMNWGAVVDQANAYTLDEKNGATMLTIPVGHTLAALVATLGEIDYVAATMATRKPTVQIKETGELAAVTSADQVVINGLLKCGAPLAVHYRGGMPKGTGLLWEINGSEGSLLLTGTGGHAQFVELTLTGARNDNDQLRKIEVPAADNPFPDVPLRARNIAGVYKCMAQDLREGTRSAPSFDTAVANHQINAAIALAASTGQRVRPEDM
jgi:predicted dehydrogenase